MLNFALCDDNVSIANKLSKMLDSIFIKNNLPGEIVLVEKNPDNLLNFIDKNNNVHVLLMDIDLKSNINGIELVNKIRKRNKSMYIIFTTAHLEYGILAYKCKTFDFLPKPITYERLEETIYRIFDDAYNSPKQFLKLDNKNTFITEDSVYFIRKEGMKLVFNTKSREYEIYSSFNNISDSLPNNFVRCHKSFIVNIDNITDINYKTNTVYLDNNPNIHCSIGSKYKKDFMEVMKNNGNFKFNLDSFNNRK